MKKIFHYILLFFYCISFSSGVHAYIMNEADSDHVEMGMHLAEEKPKHECCTTETKDSDTCLPEQKVETGRYTNSHSIITSIPQYTYINIFQENSEKILLPPLCSLEKWGTNFPALIWIIKNIN